MMALADIGVIGGLVTVGGGVAGFLFKGIHDRNIDAHGGVIRKVDILVASAARVEKSVQELSLKMENFQGVCWERSMNHPRRKDPDDE